MLRRLGLCGVFVTVTALPSIVLFSGCGPTYSTSLLMDADVQLEAARAADAPKLAPYEYTLADAYYHKAQEEQGYADYDVCIRFAKKALENAKIAKDKALNQTKESGAIGGAPNPSTSGEPATPVNSVTPANPTPATP